MSPIVKMNVRVYIYVCILIIKLGRRKLIASRNQTKTESKIL